MFKIKFRKKGTEYHLKIVKFYKLFISKLLLVFTAFPTFYDNQCNLTSSCPKHIGIMTFFSTVNCAQCNLNTKNCMKVNERMLKEDHEVRLG